MSRTPRLTAAFLEHAPSAAAAVLQELPIDETAGFLEDVPARLAAPAVNNMIPWNGARCLERVTRPRAAMILRELSIHDATSIVRLLRTQDLDAILEEMPARNARRLRTSLQYPLHQVGAWIDSDVPHLRIGDTVKDAQRALRDAGPVSHVFLESETDGRFVACVAVHEVLSADADTNLGQLPVADIAPVSNRAALSSVSFDPRWDYCLYLPVTGRRGNLLGGLSRSALRRALHEHHAAAPSSHSLAQNLLTALLVVCGGLLDLLAQTEVPTLPRGDSRHGGQS